MYRKEEIQTGLKQNTELPVSQELVDHIDTLSFTQPDGGDMKVLHQFYKQADTTLTIAARMDRGPVALLMLNHCWRTMPVIIHSSKSMDDLFHKITTYLKKVSDSGKLNTIDHLIVYAPQKEDVIPYIGITEMIRELKKFVQDNTIRDGVLVVRPLDCPNGWFCTLDSASKQGIADNGWIFNVFELLHSKKFFTTKMKILMNHQPDPEDDGNNTVEFTDMVDFGDVDVWDGQQRPDPIPGNSAENPLTILMEPSEFQSEAVNGDTDMRKADDSKAEDYMIEGITSDPEYDVINQLADLSDLEWVEYAFTNPQTGQRDSYRILNPLYEFNSDFVADPNALFVLDNEDVVHHVSHLGDDITILKSKARGKRTLGVFF